jgi:hypothetical protein
MTMNWLATETAVRIVGGLGVFFVLYSLWMGQMTATGLPDGYTNPVLAFELVKNGADIDQIKTAEDGKARDFISKSTNKDYGYILVYGLFFIGLALVLTRSNRSWAYVAGIAATACAILGAIFDLIEDRGMQAALNTRPGLATDKLADSIRYPSLAKWALLFGFALLIGILLLQRRDIFVIPAILFLLTAVSGLTGVLCNLLQPRFYWMFPAAILSMALATVFVTITFAFWPFKVTKLLITAST